MEPLDEYFVWKKRPEFRIYRLTFGARWLGWLVQDLVGGKLIRDESVWSRDMRQACGSGHSVKSAAYQGASSSDGRGSNKQAHKSPRPVMLPSTSDHTSPKMMATGVKWPQPQRRRTQLGPAL